MRGGTHALAGVLIALTMTQNSQPVDGLAVVMSGAIGALMPDLDHPKAALSRRVGLLAAPVRLVFSHRGGLHSAAAVALIAIVAMLMPKNVETPVLAALCGYASHIGLDALTVSGVPLLWPYRRRFRFLRLRTGGVVERLLFVGMLVLIIFIVVY